VDQILYLDGWEAQNLYHITDPQMALSYLKFHGVQYILDPDWVHHWDLYKALPLNTFLGDPSFFPLVFSSPQVRIFQVGPVDDIITNNSSINVSLSPQGWGETKIFEGHIIRQIEQNSQDARIFFSALNPVTVRITYLDQGSGKIDINFRKKDGAWMYGTEKILLNNSNQWITKSFTLPSIELPDIKEIGIFSSSVDLMVNKIEVEEKSN
jgi:hypothetical protein